MAHLKFDKKAAQWVFGVCITALAVMFILCLIWLCCYPVQKDDTTASAGDRNNLNNYAQNHGSDITAVSITESQSEV